MSDPSPAKSVRADQRLVELGYFESRSAARAAIEAGLVEINGEVLRKPAQAIRDGDEIMAQRVHGYVSRGGLKLAHALDVFGIDPQGLNCLDLGASTGGFSDVLLRRGAARIVAVDVGQGQLHPRLRQERRLISLEQTDARDLTLEHIGTPPDLIVCDASFISIAKLLPRPLSLAAPGAWLIALFKPQFEVGRDHVGKGGIVRNASAVAAAQGALETALSTLGWRIQAWSDSPIEGGDGNAEKLFLAGRIDLSF